MYNTFNFFFDYNWTSGIYALSLHDALQTCSFKKQERDIVDQLKRGIPQLLDMKGPHAEEVRAFFEDHGLQSQLLDVVTTYKSQIIRSQRAAEMVKEADVPQREDEVVQYLKALEIGRAHV